MRNNGKVSSVKLSTSINESRNLLLAVSRTEMVRPMAQGEKRGDEGSTGEKCEKLLTTLCVAGLAETQ